MKKILLKILDLSLTILISVVIAFSITKFVAQVSFVKGESMLPTLQDKSYVVVGKINLYLMGVDRFDIVTVEDKDEDIILIKRVIGLPNEKIAYKDNQLFINDEVINEDFTHKGKVSDFEVQLGSDEYFVIGDNRDNSKDSRNVGPFNLDDILSKGVFFKIKF